MSQLFDEIKDLTSAPREGMLYSCTSSFGSRKTWVSLLSAVASSKKIHTHSQSPKDKTILEDINSNEWKLSLGYTDVQVNELLIKLLHDYGVKSTPEMKEWLQNSISNLITVYEKQYNIKLPKEVQKMLSNLIAKMAYDRLSINQ